MVCVLNVSNRYIPEIMEGGGTSKLRSYRAKSNVINEFKRSVP